MAVTTAVLSGSIADLTGALDTKYLSRVVVVIEANSPGSLLLDTDGDRVMAGAKRVTIDKTSGAYTVTLPRTDSTDILPAGARLFRATLIYPSGTPGAGNVTQQSGWFELEADGSLSDADKWPGLEVTVVSQAVLDSIATSVTAVEADRVAVATHRTAVEGVVATTEGLMTSVIGSGGTFDDELSASIDSIGSDKMADPASAIAIALKKRSNLVNIEEFGARGDGDTSSASINTAAILQAMTEGHSMWIPEGLFYVNDTLRELINGYGLNAFGANKVRSILKAVPGMSDPVMWLGNANRHGTYRAVLKNFTIDGADTSASVVGNHGLVLHEAGSSMVENLRVRYCDYGIFAPGMIGGVIEKCEMGANNIHVLGTRTIGETDTTAGAFIPGVTYKILTVGSTDFTAIGAANNTPGTIFTATGPGTGTGTAHRPFGVDDTTTSATTGGSTAGGLAFSINQIQNNVISGGTQGVILEGGMCLVQHNTFQSVGDDPEKSIVEIRAANSAFAFGAGPIVYHNWFEGGQFRAQVDVRDTRQAKIRDNYMAGNSTLGSPLTKEAAIIAVNSDDIEIEDNSIFYYFDATPTEGRVRPAGQASWPIYVDTDTSFNYRLGKNHIVMSNAGVPYFAGEAGPSYHKNFDSPLMSAVVQGGDQSGTNTTAGAFVVGTTYTIVSAGTTDFTLIGAANSTPGTIFTATGVGTGTGTARRYVNLINTKQVSGITRNSIGRYTLGASPGKFNIYEPQSALTNVTVTGSVICFPNVYSVGNNAEIRFYEAVINAGSFVVGKAYSIQAAGTTDFTLIGAANNTVGTIFTATGVGTGTGKAGALVDPDRFSFMLYGRPASQGS